MDRLRAIFDSLGLANVDTFIASGNVVFDAGETAGLQASIETALAADLGFEVPTFLRTAGEVRDVLERRPFPEDGNIEISFLPTQPDTAAARKLEATVSGDERLAVLGREVYWWHSGLTRESQHSEARVVRILGMPTTRRSLQTVRRLTDKFLR